MTKKQAGNGLNKGDLEFRVIYKCRKPDAVCCSGRGLLFESAPRCQNRHLKQQRIQQIYVKQFKNLLQNIHFYCIFNKHETHIQFLLGVFLIAKHPAKCASDTFCRITKYPPESPHAFLCGTYPYAGNTFHDKLCVQEEV